MEKTTTYDGIGINYIAANISVGPVLCFIHGWTCSREFWIHQEPLWHHPSLLIDLPGHGKSDKPDIDYSCELFARSIKAVLDTENVSSVVLIGHSLGGVVSTTFMRIYPAMVEGIIYASSFWMLPAHYYTWQEREAWKVILRDDANFLAMFNLNEYQKGVMLAAPLHVRLSACCTDSLPHHWRSNEKYEKPMLHITSAGDTTWDDVSLYHLPLLKEERWPVKDHFLFMTEPKRWNERVESFLLDFGLMHSSISG